jgi:hypothetical protein
MRQPQRTLVGLKANASMEAAAGGNTTGDEALATISSNVMSPKAYCPKSFVLRRREGVRHTVACRVALPDDGDAVSDEHGWPMATSGSTGGDDDDAASSKSRAHAGGSPFELPIAVVRFMLCARSLVDRRRQVDPGLARAGVGSLHERTDSRECSVWNAWTVVARLLASGP